MLFISPIFAQDRGIQVTIKTMDGKILPLYHSSHALVVGISDYSNSWPRLPNAIKDAEEVAQELKRQRFNVVLSINPTKNDLEDKLNTFIYSMGAHPDDRLIFYFAGHGHTINMSYGGKMGYIVPSDAPFPDMDETGFRRGAISMQKFEENARQIQAKHVLYIFDSCFSGSIFALSRSIPSAIKDKTAKPVRQFITAGNENEEVSDESIFKAQFIEALNGEADLSKFGSLILPYCGC